jgi:putative cardiolipin synthase
MTAYSLPRLPRLLLLLTLALLGLLLSGLLLADRLTPVASGQPSVHLPVAGAATALDSELAPLLASHPGQTGVVWLGNGLDAFAARAVLTQRSGRSLDLMYYMWHDDVPGHLLAREVHAAAERGVRVRLLLDDLNAQGLDPAMMALDAHPNIELRLYNPFRNRGGLWRLVEMVQRVFSVNHRMHNKAWIADGQTAIIGGRNIGAEYFDAREDVNFRDLDLLLAGPAAGQASAIFDDYWNSAAAVPIVALNRHSARQLQQLIARIDDESRQRDAAPYLARVAQRSAQPAVRQAVQLQWSTQVQVLSDPPLKHLRSDRAGWLVGRIIDDLEGATTQANLISPYFVPGQRGSEGLRALAARGVKVGVVTNSLAANDVAAVHSGYQRYRPQLVDAGIAMHELRRHGGSAPHGLRLGSSAASLHTKAYVVDGRRGFVGSFNLDPRSAALNTEMGVLFDDPVLGAQLQSEYRQLADPALSWQVRRAGNGALVWVDASAQPAIVHTREPDAGWALRAWVRVLGWLPIESQL